MKILTKTKKVTVSKQVQVFELTEEEAKLFYLLLGAQTDPMIVDAVTNEYCLPNNPTTPKEYLKLSDELYENFRAEFC
jgi:hypothetical protein